MLRVSSQIKDETLITKYVETVIRRTFGTKDAMKLAKPVEKQQSLCTFSEAIYPLKIYYPTQNLFAHAEVGEDVVQRFLGGDAAFAGYVGKVIEAGL